MQVLSQFSFMLELTLQCAYFDEMEPTRRSLESL